MTSFPSYRYPLRPRSHASSCRWTQLLPARLRWWNSWSDNCCWTRWSWMRVSRNSPRLRSCICFEMWVEEGLDLDDLMMRLAMDGLLLVHVETSYFCGKRRMKPIETSSSQWLCREKCDSWSSCELNWIISQWIFENYQISSDSLDWRYIKEAIHIS